MAKTKLPKLDEATFQRQVIKFAKMCGYLVVHFRPARVMRGGTVSWRTPVQGDGIGFPDLILIKHRVLYIELKAEAGRASAAQREWAVRLRMAGQEVHTWRPSDWDTLAAVLLA